MASEEAPESLSMLLFWEKLFKLHAKINMDPWSKMVNSN